MATPISFAARWTEKDLNTIRERAKAREMSVSRYVRECALGLRGDEPSPDEQFEKIEQRLLAIEERLEAQGNW